MQATDTQPTLPAALAQPTTRHPDDALAHALMSVVVQLRRLPMADAVDRGSLLVLSELAVQGSARPSTIATTLRLDLSTVSRHIRALEDDGLVERSADPHDARAQSVRPRPEGLAVLEHAFRGRADRISGATQGWQPAERQQLAALLARLAHDLHPDLHSEHSPHSPTSPKEHL